MTELSPNLEKRVLTTTLNGVAGVLGILEHIWESTDRSVMDIEFSTEFYAIFCMAASQICEDFIQNSEWAYKYHKIHLRRGEQMSKDPFEEVDQEVEKELEREETISDETEEKEDEEDVKDEEEFREEIEDE